MLSKKVSKRKAIQQRPVVGHKKGTDSVKEEKDQEGELYCRCHQCVIEGSNISQAVSKSPLSP